MTDAQRADGPPRERLGISPAAGALEITVRRSGDSEVLTLCGDVDLSVGKSVRESIIRCLDARPAVLVMDLSAVTFLGSVGLSALLEAQRLAAPGTEVRIVATDRAVLRPLRLMGMDRMLSLWSTVDEALTDGH